MIKNLKELCDKIMMPQEAVDMILNNSHLADDENVKASMKKLFDKRTWEMGLAELKHHIGEDKDGFGMLACELVCALKSIEIYEKYGISEQIYVETMKCFSRFVGEHKESYGHYGFDREWWVVRQISCLLFRIGELEYELAEEKCIHLHIPSDAKLMPEEIDKSLKEAKAFIVARFPEYAGAEIKCESWLLSPTLTEVLPPSSHILDFQKYFEIKSLGIDEGEYMTWVFKRPDISLENLPENTSLQRNLKKYLLSGGKVMAAMGTFKDKTCR